jgi:hypothetical protein
VNFNDNKCPRAAANGRGRDPRETSPMSDPDASGRRIELADEEADV